MSTTARALGRDEGGAVLVLGIFMCACIVGILWYLAGIGDAIVYRERMQEAADATAYSGAVLHARGMNLIVMLNLAMACILAVRVALKVAFVVTTAIAIGFSWFPPVGGPAATAATWIDRAISASKPAIDGALKALAAVETAVARIVPPAAIAGSFQVGTKYKPIVKESAAGSPITVRDGLPVEDGSPDVLCYEAGKAVVDLIGALLPIPGAVLDVVGGGFGELVKTGGAYFCDIGSKGSPPDLSGIINGQADKGCDKQIEQYKSDLGQAQSSYQSACDSYNAPCATDVQGGIKEPSTLTPTQQQDLNKKAGAVSTAQAKVDGFNGDKCRDDARKKANQQMGKVKSQGSSGNIAPKKVKQNWKNGVNEAQVLAVAIGDEKMLTWAPKGVKAGAWKSNVNIDIPKSAEFTLAQAEFFYDCSGSWGVGECNGTNESAMWNFRWRARLRRYNTPFNGTVPGLEKLAEGLTAAEYVQHMLEINPGSSLNLQNARVFSEYGNALKQTDPTELIIH